MIQKARIRNFMSVRDTTIRFDPLTIFIGRNGSGKSAIFKALVAVSKLLNGAPVRGPQGEFNLEPGVGFDELVWRGDASLPIIFDIWFEDKEDPNYSLELRKRQPGWSVMRETLLMGDLRVHIDEHSTFEHDTERRGLQTRIAPLPATVRYMVHPYLNDSKAQAVISPVIELSKKFGQIWRYRPSADDVATFVQYPTNETRDPFVAPNGFGVARLLQELQGRDRNVFGQIEAQLQQLFPHIRGIGFDTDWRGVRLSFLTDRSQRPVPAPQESDGVLLATFLLWRLFTSGPGVTLCLEEPENGLHPVLLG